MLYLRFEKKITLVRKSQNYFRYEKFLCPSNDDSFTKSKFIVIILKWNKIVLVGKNPHFKRHAKYMVVFSPHSMKKRKKNFFFQQNFVSKEFKFYKKNYITTNI